MGLLPLLIPAVVHAQEETSEGATDPNAVQITQVDVGVEGHYKVGRWTPLAVTFTGRVPEPVQLAVWVPDPDGNLTRQPAEPVILTGTGAHRLQSIFRTGRMDGVVRVELESGGQIIASRTVRSAVVRPAEEGEQRSVPLWPPDPLGAEFWIVLGTADAYTEAAAAINLREPNPRGTDSRDPNRQAVTVIPLSDSATIPTQPDALDSIDAIAVNGNPEISDATSRAIRNWVEQGGHLVISISSAEQWGRMPLASWVPIQNVGQSRLRDLGGLRSRFARSATFRAGSVDALQFDYEYGETLAESIDGPLWVRLPIGFGRVTLLGLDLDKRPLNTWDNLPQLCERMTDFQADADGNRQQRQTAQLTRTGISDLSTQLAAAVDRYPTIELPSSWLAMGLMILYLLIIGPLDYFLVHRVLKRPHWTWMTFPLIVLASAALATASARQMHPPGMVSNQVNLIDLDLHHGTSRRVMWGSFVSPETKRYDLQVEFDWRHSDSHERAASVSQTTPPRMSWIGIPESGFRGMYRAGGLELAKTRYHFAPRLTSIEDLPVNIRSSSSITAIRFDHDADPQQWIACDLAGREGQLEGTITNLGDVPIQDWFIAYENLVYLPKGRGRAADDLAFVAGETIATSEIGRLSPRVLRNYLTGVTHVRYQKEGDKFSSDGAVRDFYDPLSRDFDRIMRTITFYRASGGKGFTTLDNDDLERLDLSPFLDLGRAVLFGRLDAMPSQLLIDGELTEPTDSPTFIRVLLPVRSR